MKTSHIFKSSLTLLVCSTLILQACGEPGNERGSRAAAPLGTDSALAFGLGIQQSYDLDYQSHSTADASTLLGGLGAQDGFCHHEVTTRIRAVATHTPILSQDGRTLTSVAFRPVTVLTGSKGQEDAVAAERIRRTLEQGATVESDQDGRTIALWVQDRSDALGLGVIRTLLGLTQFVSSEARAEKWDAQEYSANGTRTASYTRTGDHSVRKEIVRYDEEASPLKGPRAHIAPKGHLDVTLTDEPRLLLVVCGTLIETVSISDRPYARVVTQVDVRHRGSAQLKGRILEDLSEKTQALVTRTRALGLQTEISESDSESLIQRSELGRDTQADIRGRLQKISALTQDTEKSDVYLKLKALFFLKPETCADFASVLLEEPEGSVRLSLVREALSAVGHPAAQQTLLQALQARVDEPKIALSLITSIGSLTSPIIDCERVLATVGDQAKHQELANTARLALGIVAGQLTKEAPARHERIVQQLLDASKHASSEDDLRGVILALGNTGSQRALPTITGCLERDSATLRAAACRALRFFEGSDTEGLLSNRLLLDACVDVRLEAAQALAERQASAGLLELHAKSAIEDSSPLVRLAALETLWSLRDRFPRVKPIVERLAQTDASEDVRKTATALLRGEISEER